jgi:predicted alpha/beta superfamily hydrolase
MVGQMAKPLLFVLWGLLLLVAVPATGQSSTAAANVFLLDEAFAMPQLNRSRSIWIYLPPDYESSGHNYPVVYMHDGQDLFDAERAYGGVEWKVDESLNALFGQEKTSGAIVVAIARDSEHRANEYVPWEKSDGSGGEGERYIRFIAETLKPHIDKNYRTLPGREHTAMMGASLGGVISMYAAVRFPEVFGKIGLISPALWFVPEITDYVVDHPHEYKTRVYMVISEEEGENPVNQVHWLHEKLLEMDGVYDPVKKKITATGGHDETYYRAQFPEAYRWLFPYEEEETPEPEPTGIEDLDPEALGIRLYPNPGQHTIYIQLPDAWSEKTVLQLVDAQGRRQQAALPYHAEEGVSIAHLPPGVYYLLITHQQKRVSLPLIKL